MNIKYILSQIPSEKSEISIYYQLVGNVYFYEGSAVIRLSDVLVAEFAFFIEEWVSTPEGSDFVYFASDYDEGPVFSILRENGEYKLIDHLNDTFIFVQSVRPALRDFLHQFERSKRLILSAK
ncbi:DUF7878 domain-containing protein [Ponticaulis koreensis]|uniref:DUF7878 domain-containing protein n=1 Tax=Ponticaulis koreensis TaxID=1123045 RepID=UPI0003B70C13|nr:hypothetical protein [Ponticaulis koreensis]